MKRSARGCAIWCCSGRRRSLSHICEATTGAAMGESPVDSVAMIFGHCGWIPPSAKAALGLLFGIGGKTDIDIANGEAIIAAEYVSAGKTQVETQKELASLNICFGTYEVPPDNTNHSRPADPARLQPAGISTGK